MNTITDPVSPEELAVRMVYKNLLQAWNNTDAKAFASLFATDASLVGFDGSQMNGREEMISQLEAIFKNHQTAKYVSIIRQVRFLTSGIAILRAVVGMVPPGKTDINPAVNAIQSAVIGKEEDKYRIQLFQNTPAAFHGRPGESEKLSKELRKELELAKDAG